LSAQTIYENGVRLQELAVVSPRKEMRFLENVLEISPKLTGISFKTTTKIDGKKK
jgi:hypothetical protein